MVPQIRPLFTKPEALAGFSHIVAGLAACVYFYSQYGHGYAGIALVHMITVSLPFGLRTI